MTTAGKLARWTAVTGVLALAGFVALSGPSSAQVVNKCQAGKKKCVAKAAHRLLACHAKAERRGTAVEARCLAKAASGFTSVDGKGCIDKIEARGNCLTLGDATALQARIDTFVLDTVQALDPFYPFPVVDKCSAAKKKCVSRKVTGLLACYAKAASTGTLDLACVQRHKDRFDGGADPSKGCFAKREAKGTCTTTDDTAALEATIDAFVADVVCALDPSDGTCPTVTPTPTATPGGATPTGGTATPGGATPTGGTATPGGPTATPTPSLCGNGALDPGEDCDLSAGVTCETGANTGPGFTCSASCECACPTTVTFLPDELDPVSKLDVGWTGIAHSSGILSDGLLTATVSGCAGSSRPCGVCTLGGPVENAGTNVLKSRRCTNNTSLKCTSNAQCVQQCVGGTKDGVACTTGTQCPGGSCPAAGTCQFFFGSNLPLSSGGVATCTANEVAGALTGTANIETGESATTLNLTAHVFTGITTDQPCPQCNGDGAANDGVAGGTCAGGDRNGLACDVNGVSPNVSFGSTSLDCPPLAGANIANLAIALGNSTGQEKKTLTAANPNCRALGYTTNKCFCDTCNNPSATPCSSNADCVAVGASVCGGKRCLSGSNAGAACTTTSQCPGGSCTIPGQPTAPNACLPPDGAPDGCQPVGNDRGECTDGPTDNNCAPPEQHRGCTGPADCPVTGNCVPALRQCFLDMGVAAGNGDCAGGSNEGASCTADSECPGGICQQRGELIAEGAASTPVNDHSTPTVAAVFCIGPTGASAVNSVAGLPGPARLILKGQANGLP